MNRPQRIVLFAAAGLVALLVLFPPHNSYTVQTSGSGLNESDYTSYPKGYSWIWNDEGKTDYGRLGLEAGGLLAVTVLLVFALKKPAP